MITQEKEEHKSTGLSIQVFNRAFIQDIELLEAREELEYTHKELALARRAIEQLQTEQDSKDREALEYACKVEREKFKNKKRDEDSNRPRLITWGQQSTQSKHPTQKSVIDYLSLTSENHIDLLEELILLLIPNARVVDNKSGLYGYKKSRTVVLNGQYMGMLAYEGNKGKNGIERPLLSLSGDGCRNIRNWEEVLFYFDQLTLPKITRIDIALDFFDDDRYTIEVVQKAHLDGLFMNSKSRKNPLITPYGSIQPDGSNPGRTLYIGSKDSNKRMRCYEKDLEMWGKLLSEHNKKEIGFSITPESIEIPIEYLPPQGATLSTRWLRFELQYRSKNLDLDLKMILERDKYFAGAYPYCGELIEMNTGIRPKALKTKSQISIELKDQSCKKMFGNFLYTRMLGMTPQEVYEHMRDKVWSYKLDPTLIEDGLLNEENEIKNKMDSSGI